MRHDKDAALFAAIKEFWVNDCSASTCMLQGGSEE